MRISKPNRSHFLLSLIGALLLSVSINATTLSYESHSVSGVTPITTTILHDKGEIIITEKSTHHFQKFICRLDYSVKRWEYQNKQQRISFIAYSDGKTITINGQINALEITKSISQNNLPWYQSARYAFPYFQKHLSRETPFSFLQFKPNNPNIVVTVLRFSKQDPLKATVRHKGFLGLFSKIHYTLKENGYVQKEIIATNPRIETILTRVSD